MLRHSLLFVYLVFPSAAHSQNANRNTGGGVPFVSPDGRYVAFNAVRDGKQSDTYVIRADGTNEVRISTLPEYDGAPAWLGTRVLYSSGGRPTDTTRVFSANADGSDLKQLLSVSGREFRPSPNGRQLLYSAGDWRSAQLTLSDIDGKNARAITDGGEAIFNAAWSPDGRRIAYAIAPRAAGTLGQLQIGVMNADGTERRTLTNFTAPDGSPQWPAWSPDGATLAVQVGKYSRENPAANTAHIYLIDVATGKATKLAPHDRAYLDETPSWFPDGKRLAFQSDRTGVLHVWVMSADGTGARQVTSATQ